MPSRLALTVLLLPLLAVAAPVPKRKPAFGAFGEFTDSRTKCRAQVKDEALTVTVPREQPAVDPFEVKPLPPTVGRVVEGDFVLTVRMTHALPDGAGSALEGVDTVAVASGLSVVADTDDGLAAMTAFERVFDGRRWYTLELSADREAKSSHWSESGTAYDPDDALRLRVTRVGAVVRFERSPCGTKWYHLRDVTLEGLPARVLVGPVAFQCTDQDFAATFDEFQLQSLPGADGR